MSSPGPQIDSIMLDRLCESLRVNPSWEAAADYAGVASRTVRSWRTRAEQYESRLNGTTEVTDLAAIRVYRDAEALHADPATRQEALRALAHLDGYLDRDHDRGYWLAVERMKAARARLEFRLNAEMYRIATRSEKDADRIKAITALLRWGWRDRYAERVELTGADGGALEVQMADAESRAQAALEQWQAKRAQEA